MPDAFVSPQNRDGAKDQPGARCRAFAFPASSGPLKSGLRAVQIARMKRGEWADLAVPGTEIVTRVTPAARGERMSRDDLTSGGAIRIAVTAQPEDGRANVAVTKALAKALGVAPSRLVLVRGDTSRDKVFRVLA
jgi:uncharacterized protein YggU (UPF0235/DUF167 family)